MLKEKELDYFLNWIPYSQEVENLSSLSLETRRIPDPYVFMIDEDGLKTPQGKQVRDEIKKDTPLEQREYYFVLALENWAVNNEEGIAVWFSPAYQDTYPNVKITMSEIVFDTNLKKILFNRAIVLAINNKACLDLANQFSPRYHFIDPEDLRQTPLKINDEECSLFMKALACYTEQTSYIENGEDLKIKAVTYSKVKRIQKEISTFGYNGYYPSEMELAKRQGLIGKHQPSCPASSNIQHPLFSRETPAMKETKILICTCPKCHVRVMAMIHGGQIHCPNCGASAPYRC